MFYSTFLFYRLFYFTRFFNFYLSNKWLKRATEIVKDLKHHHTKQVNSSTLVHFYSRNVFIIAFLQTIQGKFNGGNAEVMWP